MIARFFSPALRSGLLILGGSALMLLPFALGLSVAAIMVGVIVGTVAVTLGVTGTASTGRGTIPISAQAVYDRGLALGLLLTAVLFGLSGDASALAFFGAAGLAALIVAGTTRYSTGTAS